MLLSIVRYWNIAEYMAMTSAPKIKILNESNTK